MHFNPAIKLTEMVPKWEDGKGWFIEARALYVEDYSTIKTVHDGEIWFDDGRQVLVNENAHVIASLINTKHYELDSREKKEKRENDLGLDDVDGLFGEEL